MQTTFKTIYFISIGILIAASGYFLFGKHALRGPFSQLDFVEKLFNVILLASPLAVVGILFGVLKEDQSAGRKLFAIGVAFILAFFLALILLIMANTMFDEPPTYYD